MAESILTLPYDSLTGGSLSIREAIITRVMEAGGRLKVRSALNPMLWLCGIITAPSLIVYGLKLEPSPWLLIFAFAPEATAILGFFFLLFFDRDKLQSEEYQLRKIQLEMIEEKGRGAIEATEVEVIPNPATPELLTGDVEEE